MGDEFLSGAEDTEVFALSEDDAFWVAAQLGDEFGSKDIRGVGEGVHDKKALA